MIQNNFFLTAGKNQLYLYTWEPQDPPTGLILLIHGLGEHCGRYQHVAEVFTRAGFAVWGFDHRGHGRTAGPRGHIPSFDAACDDVDAVLARARQQLGDALPAFIYGHSLGGAIALYYGFKRAAARGLRGFVVTSPGLATAAPVGSLKKAFARLAARLVPALPIDNGLDVTGLSQDPAVITAYQRDPFVHRHVSAALGSQIIDQGEWMITSAGDFPLPLLLLQGTADRLVNPAATKKFASRMGSNVLFKEWQGGYHELHNEPYQDDVLRAILDWLTNHCA